MSPEQIKVYRITYICVAALFLIIFMLTGRLLYLFFASICLTISANPEAVHKHNDQN